MEKISEDYVSSEIAKLLKEKGFSELTTKVYPYFEGKDYRYDISCPTLQMAMKWLREVHNIFICIIPSEVGAGVMDYTYVLYKIDVKDFYFEDLGIQGRVYTYKISFEETCEEAIKYCLKHLI